MITNADYKLLADLIKQKEKLEKINNSFNEEELAEIIENLQKFIDKLKNE